MRGRDHCHPHRYPLHRLTLPQAAAGDRAGAHGRVQAQPRASGAGSARREGLPGAGAPRVSVHRERDNPRGPVLQSHEARLRPRHQCVH